MKRTFSLSAMLLLSTPAIAAPDAANNNNIEVDQSSPIPLNSPANSAQEESSSTGEHASNSSTDMNDVDECPSTSPKLKAWWPF